MADEKIITINLRKKLLKVGRWRRNKAAVSRTRETLKKFSKAEKVVFERKLVDRIFLSPLTKVKVRISKLDDKSVRAELAE